MTESCDAHDLASMAAELAADRKAQDVAVIDLRGRSAMTDYFVICSGRSDIQVRAICERVAQGMAEAGHRALSQEGINHGHWGLLDYGEVVVHVFLEPVRKLYDLERLWAADEDRLPATETGGA